MFWLFHVIKDLVFGSLELDKMFCILLSFKGRAVRCLIWKWIFFGANFVILYL